MIVLGLTGSIGMGKSTLAALFVKAGIPVHDSDKAVFELYQGQAVPLIGKIFPEAVENGIINRLELFKIITTHGNVFKTLEAIVHPLVEEKIKNFISFHQEKKEPLIVIESPLLFETKIHKLVDKTLVASAPLKIQRQRVLERADMTTQKLKILLAHQMPDYKKRKKADYIVNTACSLDILEKKINEIITILRIQENSALPKIFS